MSDLRESVLFPDLLVLPFFLGMKEIHKRSRPVVCADYHSPKGKTHLFDLRI